MTDIEKRAHDIAMRILPYTLKEYEPDFAFLTFDERQRDYKLRSFEIVEEYTLLYEALLKDLEECGEL